MFKNNMGGLDRAIRGIIGIILLALFFMGSVTGVLGWIALIVGIVFLATGIFGTCPLYSILGMSTGGTKKA